MSGDCTAASTYGALVGPVTLDVPGHVTITSASHGTCMSINHVIPWTLTTVHNSKCLDYAFGTDANNVYSHNCHGNDNQQWYMVNGNIYSLHDAKCLDYHTGTDNVYMHDCHDGSNQKWYFDEDTKAIRSEYDHRCLDVAGTDNVYVQTCHFQTNQQWDRHETTGKAFELALQMPCSGSAAESITVEPIGSHQKFRLKSQGHTLDGEYKFSSNKKIERVDVANKCMEADYQLSGVDQETCVDSLEQEWVIGHGLQGLADAPIACVGNQVISYFEKTSSQIRYKCVHVSSLGMCSPGYSEQVDTKSLELEDVKSLRLMTATCPVGHGLRSLMAEASDKGAWIRLRYECCQISRVPVTVYPYLLSSELRDFDTGMANAWEGVYCPTSLDSSGRMQFSQSRSFKPGQNPSGTLTYDKFQGQWCVTGKTCAASDIVHPLDSPLGGSEWRVVPVSDFDAQFEARGVKPSGGNRKRKPPPLIKFGATDPEYLPECKDESHPGTRKFKLEIMNSEAESLDDENPCKYVFGKSPSDKSLEDAEGMTGWKDDLKGNTGAGVGGVTYKSVKECADREITRELRMANWAEDHFNKTNGLDFTRDFLSGIADIYPAAEAAPLGAGFEFHPGALIYLIGHMAINGAEMGYNRQLQNREMKYEEVGHDDCNSIQHGFARTFCDLHCIRDAVRKGNDAILRAMEEAVEVIGKNTQILLEHYVGESSGSGLLQEGKKIQEGIQHHVAEMAALASSALEPKASLLAQRALSSFTQRWGSDQGANSSGLLQEVRDLHSTMAFLSQRKLSQTEEVQQRALEMAGHMGKFLEVKAHMLGVYRQRAHAGKFIQRWLRTNFRQVTASDVLSEMEEQAAEHAMEEFDTMWWEIRQELDTYLQASQDYVDATNSAVQMLHSYTSECQAGFSALKQSYALSARAEKKAHEALKKTWSTVSVRMGAMASKVMDGGLLERLATHDIQHIDVGSLMASHHQPCSSDALSVVETAVKVAMKKGVFGQTYWQLKELLEEMAMLQQRFAVHGQNAPDASTLTEAAARFTQATKQTTSARERLARKMLAHWQQGAC
ncbi:unnamed protein product [Effrenium voratum]|uniref:Ricin B lectin domain-containing protein n=1 Tax=Effrenium voratum TaxID=2562239 RepID=A0AA36MXN0_9DINO|nr:unnamed protein product [Effrenium voratum]